LWAFFMKKPTISAVLIVKNEEVLLGQCLDSIQGVDEIIIVDTGSKDRTVELAKLYTDKIYTDYIWEDSFCKARNHAKSKATGDWILSIDADEILHDFGAVREAVEMAEQRQALAVDCTMIASDNGQEFLYPRIFKNSTQVWWEGNIHNHLSVIGEFTSNVRITHGYSPAHNLDPDRAYRILKKEVATRPDAVREMFYLGREHFYRGEFESCVLILGKYVQRGNYLPEKAEAFLIMGRAYWNLHMAEDARDAILQALKINANFKEAIVFMSVLAGKGTGNDKWEANAKQWERMAETADNSDVLFVRNVFDFR
jgi:glycosyltransferase involved in cell wall biosynthesis